MNAAGSGGRMVMAAEGGWATGFLWVIALIGIVGGVGLAGYGCSNLVRHGRGHRGMPVVLRSLAAFAGAAAAAAYLLGALGVALAILNAEDGGSDSTSIHPCRTPDWRDRDAGIVGYTVDFLPLRFVCRTDDGGSYAAGAVPGFVNPAVLVLSLTSITLAVSAAVAQERRTSNDTRRHPLG